MPLRRLQARGGYGTFTMTETGAWTYTLDDANSAVQALNVGSVPLTDSFTVTTVDGTAQLVTITITGTNDAAIITGTTTGAVDEAGVVPGTPTATGDLLATDVDNAADAFQAVAPGAATTNGYGTYGVTAAGVWTYTLDNTNATVNALNELSPPLSDTFTVLSADGTAQLVTITITGTNDAAIITGTTTGAVDEAGVVPGTPTATGDLLATDVDNAADAFQAVAPGAATTNGYGTYGVTAAGVWTYTLDNTNATVNALNESSPPLSDTFTVLSADGTAQLVTITITGTNDAAIITGTTTGAVDEAGVVPGTPTATGDLLATDVDNAADAFQAVAPGAATTNGYGTYGVTAAGVWTYTLDNTNATVNALNELSPPLSDTFTVLSADGTPQLVTITITGTNDAAIITGTTTGAVDEAGVVPGTPTATGDLLATDVDNAADAFQAVAPGAATTNGYGTYGVTAAGVWTYTLDNTNATVNALNESSPPLSDTFTVLSADGTAQLVTITITGSNDAAIITGTATGAVDEAGVVPGTPTATGDLLATDVDNAADVFQAVAPGAATTNGYGTYGVTAAGVWTYTLDNTNATVNALNELSPPLSDTFTVSVCGRHPAGGDDHHHRHQRRGDHHRHHDRRGRRGWRGAWHPDGDGRPAGDRRGQSRRTCSRRLRPAAATTNGYGTYAVTAAGVWTYTLDNSNATVQALNKSSPPLTDTFTVLSADGTAQVVTITITGTNDAAIITGTATGRSSRLAWCLAPRRRPAICWRPTWTMRRTCSRRLRRLRRPPTATAPTG